MTHRTPSSPRSGEEQTRRRADRFFSAFLLTENGRPKSSLILYTFSLSLLFAAIYALCYEGAIHLLTAPLSALTAWVSNGIIALLASGIGAALCGLLHRLFADKRLVFGGHLWLCLYAAAILVAMLAMLGISEAFGDFLVFFGWMIAFPVLLGTAVSALLFRRDYQRKRPPEAAPAWKKYVNSERM